MAILHHGILGGFSGKVGNIVGYRYKSHWCIRRCPSPSSKTPTPNQVSHREKFARAIQTAMPLCEQLKGLPLYGKKQASAYNRLVSNLMRSTLTPSGMDYQLLQITRGVLPTGSCHTLYSDNGIITICWCATNTLSQAGQEAMVNVYSPSLQKWASFSLPVDENCELSVKMPCDMLSTDAFVYLYFKTKDSKQVSNTICLGNAYSSPDINSFINLN